MGPTHKDKDADRVVFAFYAPQALKHVEKHQSDSEHDSRPSVSGSLVGPTRTLHDGTIDVLRKKKWRGIPWA